MEFNHYPTFDFSSQSEQASPLEAISCNFGTELATQSVDNAPCPPFDFKDIILKPHNDGPWVPNQRPLPTDFPSFDYGNNVNRAHTVADPAHLGYTQRPALNPRESFTSTDDSGFYDRQSLRNTPDTAAYPPFNAQGFLTPNAPPPPTSTKSAPINRKKRARSPFEDRPCLEVGCKKVSKSNSEFSKHLQQHEKKHICRVPGCNRKQGFGTENDLDRHQSSVHKMMRRLGNKKEYQCVECRRTTHGTLKVWDRRDNFKSHIRRRHPGTDEDLVVARSEKVPVFSGDSGFGGSQVTESPVYQDLVPPISTTTSATMSRDTSYSSELPESNFAQGHSDSFAGIGSGPMHVNFGFGQSLSPATHQVGLRNFSQQIPNIATTMTGQTTPSDLSQLQISPCYSTLDLASLNFEGSYFSPDGMNPAQAEPYTAQIAEPVYQPTDSKSVVGEPAPCFVCPTCFKTKKRACDLRKHEKRHRRPYGCTFEGCQMRLGSRNDWKRHESSQHHLKEIWWCRPCRLTFDKQKNFAGHLEKNHGFRSGTDEIKFQCNQMHLGPEGHSHFWCGFCNDIIPEDANSQSEVESTMSAWEYRFKHIGDHYDKEERPIESWTFPDQTINRPAIAVDTRSTAPTIRSHDKSFKDVDDSDLGESGISRSPFDAAERPIPPPGFRMSMSYNLKRMMIPNGNANVPDCYDDTKDADGEDDNCF